MIKNWKLSKLFKKVKNKHTILSDFISFLQNIEKCEYIKKIIPWRLSRQQKGSSGMYIHFAYFTDAGMKFNMSKWGTSQELFIICPKEHKEQVKDYIQKNYPEYIIYSKISC